MVRKTAVLSLKFSLFEDEIQLHLA